VLQRSSRITDESLRRYMQELLATKLKLSNRRAGRALRMHAYVPAPSSPEANRKYLLSF
jgi:hypothetical protein